MSKEIELSQGKVALVDDKDYGKLNKHKWCAHKDGGTFYAVGGTPQVKMHRVILRLQSDTGGEITDHINRNGLDNRRANLRVVNHTINGRNRKTSRNNKSGHNGVSWDSVNYKWKACISVNNKTVTVGRYNNINDAVQARKDAEVLYWDE